MKKVLVVLAILLLAVSAHAQNLVTNGEFAANTNGWTMDKAGWGSAIYGNSGPIDAWGPQGTYTPNCLSLHIGTGDGFCTWAYQTVTGLTVGNTYNFTAKYGGGNGGVQNVNPETMAWWEVGMLTGGYNNGSVDSGVGSISKTETSGATHFGFGWKDVNYNFTATSDTYTIYLKQGRVNANWQAFGSYFDAVSIVDTTPAPPVPEPSSVIALGTGLMGLAGFVVRRRK